MNGCSEYLAIGLNQYRKRVKAWKKRAESKDAGC